MCDFKPGDEVVCIREARWSPDTFQPKLHSIYTVATVEIDCGQVCITLEEGGRDDMFRPRHFRKVIRRNDSLSIEAFLTIKPGFEEPKRAPAKKRERV